MATRWRATTGWHIENHYWRAFNMNTFTGGLEYDITSVEFGIELAQSATGTGQPVTVNLYANTARRSLMAAGPDSYVWRAQHPGPGRHDIQCADRDSVPAGTLELVMEVMTPMEMLATLSSLSARIRIQRPDKLHQRGRLRCTRSDAYGDIGFPDMHYVFNVNGSCPVERQRQRRQHATPTPTATTDPPLQRLQPTPQRRPHREAYADAKAAADAVSSSDAVSEWVKG